MERINIKKAAKKDWLINFILSRPSFRSSPAYSTIITNPIAPKYSTVCSGIGKRQPFAFEISRSTIPAANNNSTEGIRKKFDIIENRYDTTITLLNKINIHSGEKFSMLYIVSKYLQI